MEGIINLQEMDSDEFLVSLIQDDLDQICWIVPDQDNPGSSDSNRNRIDALLSIAETPYANMTKMERVSS